MLGTQSLGRQHMLDLGGADAERQAPKAPWVEVWLSPQTMVVPGRVQPCSGPMIWTMPWRMSFIGKYSMPNSLAFFSRVSTCSLDSGSVMPLSRSLVGTLWSATAKRQIGAADFAARHAQAFESLGAGHFMHQMPVDIEDRGLTRARRHQMGVPDLVVQRLGHGLLFWVVKKRLDISREEIDQ